MQISRQDRNTGITIALVLVVCTASLIALGSSLVSLIAPGVSRLATTFGARVRTVTIDYNFAAPTLEQANNASTAMPATVVVNEPKPVAAVNSNFPVPQIRSLSPILDASIGKRIAIEKDAQQLGYGLVSEATMQVSFHLRIPAAGIYTPVFNGNDAVYALANGMWQHPSSYTIQSGDSIVMCERSWFNAYDSRSCLFLNEVKPGDELQVIIGEQVFNYEVVAKNIFKTGNTLIYQAFADSHYLKIVTNDPAGSNASRLVIMAIPVTELQTT